jgi:Family of unknown function (DUF5335)
VSRTLERDEWGPYLFELTRRLGDGSEVQTRLALVADDTAGIEAERLPLDSITYEDGDDQIAIGLGSRSKRFPVLLWHFVDRPRLLWVNEEDDDVPGVIVVESEDGTVTRLELS